MSYNESSPPIHEYTPQHNFSHINSQILSNQATQNPDEVTLSSVYERSRSNNSHGYLQHLLVFSATSFYLLIIVSIFLMLRTFKMYQAIFLTLYPLGFIFFSKKVNNSLFWSILMPYLFLGLLCLGGIALTLFIISTSFDGKWPL